VDILKSFATAHLLGLSWINPYFAAIHALPSLKWSWGWAFELKYDSLPSLYFKGDVCICITLDPPVA